jgi:uncharacterized damage-inducible protein DinB
LERDVLGVPRHLGTDLVEFLPQRRQRPMLHWFRQSQPPQKVVQVVRQGKQLQSRLIVFERAAGELRPVYGYPDDVHRREWVLKTQRGHLMEINELIDEYATGPQKLRDVIAGMTPGEIDAAPVPGKWSTRQIICHLADFEPVYADRIKHVIAEKQPSFAGGFHQQFAEHLAYDQRDIEEELTMIEVTRSQMARILRSLPLDAFVRTGIHSVDGPMTLRSLLERITNHIPHHSQFIEEKKQALRQ